MSTTALVAVVVRKELGPRFRGNDDPPLTIIPRAGDEQAILRAADVSLRQRHSTQTVKRA